MNIFERIQDLAKQNGKNLQDVSVDLGFSKNLFYRWKTSEPKATDIKKVASYFNVTTDYLLGCSDNSEIINEKFLQMFKSEGAELTEDEKIDMIEDVNEFLEFRKRMLNKKNN
ncbi:helix-turn-helix transcriptional regulator [Brochothrix thermosphacta]|uniref:helix-turn-helix domain-containing protein n=1 Tax=Brochothrix thermosphacta TaxID=2756 RepID=UPI0027133C81|nr:helix-turn-helix transcriptional regulator [Brochothrix thermosphacta]MDO7864920.1 helix-turn-helix transcriptional regulator [Brochothrix thermosphacta]